MVRIDFMFTPVGELYLTEINPIPGSMAYYLWEATGVSFTQQITDLIEQAERDHVAKKSLVLDYKTDIVEKFIAQ
jgi:D-alanine-D-alanine ligase